MQSTLYWLKRILKSLDSPIPFVLNNFERPFENDRYIVLSVPKLRPPDPKAEIALISPSLEAIMKDKMTSTVNPYEHSTNEIRNIAQSNKQVEHFYNNQSFIMKPQAQLLFNTNESDVYNKPDSRFKIDINYLESKLKILERGPDPDNHAGVFWSDDINYYSAVIRHDLLEVGISKNPNYFDPNNATVKSIPINPTSSTNRWLTMEVLYANGTINILLDGDLRMEIPQNNSNTHISKAGLGSWNTETEFLLPHIGEVSLEDNMFRFGKLHNYDYYYLTSELAKAGLSYDSLLLDDASWTSKKVVVLSDDLVEMDNEFQTYLSRGGTVVLLSNQDNKGTD